MRKAKGLRTLRGHISRAWARRIGRRNKLVHHRAENRPIVTRREWDEGDTGKGFHHPKELLERRRWFDDDYVAKGMRRSWNRSSNVLSGTRRPRGRRVGHQKRARARCQVFAQSRQSSASARSVPTGAMTPLECRAVPPPKGWHRHRGWHETQEKRNRP